MPKDNVNLLHS